MRKSTALHKKVKVNVKAWHDIYGVDFIDLTINDIFIGKLKGKPMECLASALNTQFVSDMEHDFIADTIKVDKGNLLVNGAYICELSHSGLWAIHGAFHEITGYTIYVDHSTLRYTYSWSQDWHVENLSHREEDIETKDYVKTLKALKKKYAPLVEHNRYFSFKIIEYRGDDFNRVLMYDNVGCVPENFDEKIRERVFK